MRGICGTGLKKCSPTRRSGRASFAARGSSMRLEVLVASRAPGFMRGSSCAYSSCLASRFSKMASMTTSAPGTPSPATSALSRARAAAFFAGSRTRLSNSSCARFRAGCTYSRARSCSVTVNPRSADQAAMSPPMTPAPTTCTCLMSAALLPPALFRRSCNRNTRTRLREVSVVNRCAIERASASNACGPCAPNRAHRSMMA